MGDFAKKNHWLPTEGTDVHQHLKTEAAKGSLFAILSCGEEDFNGLYRAALKALGVEVLRGPKNLDFLIVMASRARAKKFSDFMSEIAILHGAQEVIYAIGFDLFRLTIDSRFSIGKWDGTKEHLETLCENLFKIPNFKIKGGYEKSVMARMSQQRKQFDK